MGKVFMSRTEKSIMEKKLVGVHIPKKDAHRLALLSLKNNIPRTTILLGIINDYLDKQPTLSEMVEKAVKRANKAYHEKERKSAAIFDQFCKEIKEDLASHRIEPEISEQIITEFKQLNKG